MGDTCANVASLKNGFTLVELMIVIGVISVLSASILLIMNPFTQFQRARDGQRKSDLAQIQHALEQYYNDNQAYPAYVIIPVGAYSHFEIADPVANPTAPNNIDWGTTWGTYMKTLPKDPGSNVYAYKSYSSQQAYALYASLERNNDPQLCPVNGIYGGFSAKCSSNTPGSGACGGGKFCNYGVTSPNWSP